MSDAKANVQYRIHADTLAGYIAKKDFTIKWNEYYREIQAGEDLRDVPRMFFQNLKTENVI